MRASLRYSLSPTKHRASNDFPRFLSAIARLSRAAFVSIITSFHLVIAKRSVLAAVDFAILVYYHNERETRQTFV